MADKGIDVGDKVEVWWSYSETPDIGVVNHRPCGEGDMWYIAMTNKSGAKFVMAVNPYSHDLQHIIRTETDNGD